MNKQSMAWLSLAGAAVFLTGCASTASRLDASIGQPVGVLTRVLGEPDADFTLQTGERVLQWQSISARKQPRYAYSAPRLTYATSLLDTSVAPDSLGQSFDVDTAHTKIEACVVWVAIDDAGTIRQGAAHGKGC